MATHQIQRGWRAARSSTIQGSAEPLCVRIKGTNRQVSEEKADVCPRSVFFLRGLARSGQREIFALGFSGICIGLLDGWMLARAPASPARGHTPMDFGISVFLISVLRMALGNLGLLMKTDESVICPFCC